MSPSASRRSADLVVEALANEGVDHVFGLPGTTIMDLIDALGMQDRVRYIAVRHEQVAGFMADGFARATGRVAVCTASRGPGAANLAIALHNAYSESVPLVALVGHVANRLAHKDAFEEMDLVTFFTPVSKWSFAVHEADAVAPLAARAVRTARNGRPRPVAMSVPVDALQAEVPSATPPAVPTPLPPQPHPQAITDAVRLLSVAERPVVIVGGGCAHDSSTAIVELAERLAAPVVTTWLRKALFPNRDRSYLGALGFGASRSTENVVIEADVVLAIGCRFSEFTTRQWSLLPDRCSLIHVDIDVEELGRVYPPAVSIVADAHATARAIVDALPGPDDSAAGRQRVARLAEVRRHYDLESRLPSIPAGPGSSSAALVHALQVVLDTDDRAVLVQDAPTFGGWIARYLKFDRPQQNYASPGGAMGWGFPAALGIQLGRPDDHVICVTGDGSFYMVAQDLETAVREDIPVVVVVTNNFAFGNTRDRQRLDFDRRYNGVFYQNPDFAAYARLLGADEHRVERNEGLLPTIRSAIATRRPTVIDVIQDPFEGLPPAVRPPSVRDSADSR